jgi:cytoskeletal protein RodZ
MPVLSQPASHGSTHLPGADMSVTYVFLGAFLLVLLGVHMKNRRRPHSMETPSSTSQSEKESKMSNQNAKDDTSRDVQSAALQTTGAKPRIQRPLQPPPFTPPQPEVDILSCEPFSPENEMPPMRRSYTRTTTAGTEFSGEIIVAEGWRRHTRVFGGGVCQACEESERRMSA